MKKCEPTAAPDIKQDRSLTLVEELSSLLVAMLTRYLQTGAVRLGVMRLQPTQTYLRNENLRMQGYP